MRSLDVGSVCIKTTGREAGERVSVVEIKDDNFVIIEGQRVRKRRCNIAHLIPIGENAAEAKAHKGHHAKAHAAKHTEKKKNKEDKKN